MLTCSLLSETLCSSFRRSNATSGPSRQLPSACRPAHHTFACRDGGFVWATQFPVTTLVTWECTIAHAVPWDYVNIWEALTTPKGSFMTAVMAKSLAYERGRSPMPAGWIACDPLAVALAAEHDVAEERGSGSADGTREFAPLLQESTMIHCAVELTGAITRGQCVFDWNAAGKAEPNVRLVTKVDLERFANLLHDSML